MGGLWVLSSQPGRDLPPPFPHADKVVHFVLYAGLGGLLEFGLRARPLWIPLSIAAGYGVIDEIHQLYVPGRSFDWMDIAADALGALVAIVVLRRLSCS